ncbi:MAG TPA: hypothetical protein PK609_00135 [Candidatus Paceibacterota bacterium]|nr:hypothetical protein [Candidatus Paceibacterota bacterium]
MGVLSAILNFLFPPRRSSSLVATTTPLSLASLVREQELSGNMAALLPYRNELVKACVLEAKFHDSARAQELLGGVLASYLADLDEDSSSLILIPLPLSKERRAKRGYNQAERIARYTDIGTLRTDILVRTRDTAPQTSLGREERKLNVVGAFSVQGAIDPSYTYIVFDDVLTTGATLSAAMEALWSAGAQRVRGVALAH